MTNPASYESASRREDASHSIPGLLLATFDYAGNVVAASDAWLEELGYTWK